MALEVIVGLAETQGVKVTLTLLTPDRLSVAVPATDPLGNTIEPLAVVK